MDERYVEGTIVPSVESKPGTIYKSMVGVMKEIGAIKKEKQTSFGDRYRYRGIDDVMNALQPALINNGVFIVPEVLEQTREDRQSNKGGLLIHSICKVRYTFFAEDGSSISTTVIGEGMDSGDKATNKAMAIAMKYACFQVFCIPTEEMHDADANLVDPDAEVHQVSGKASAPAVTKGGQKVTDFKRSNAKPVVNTPAATKPAESTNREPQKASGKDPTKATNAQLETIAKLCASTSEKKPQAFHENDLYGKFGTTKETCSIELAAKIMNWFKKNFPEIEA
jgi:hypothetical protein